MEAPDDDAMAQMMGFSSFGAQDHPQKKRRYNAGADAVVSADPQPSSTGSNSTPLGTRPAPPGDVANADEIDLEDDQVVENTHVEATTLPHGLPQRPAVSAGSQPNTSKQDTHRGPHGPRNDGRPWYEGYYDTLSNRNPWERLERTMGLQPRGTWVSQDTGST